MRIWLKVLGLCLPLVSACEAAIPEHDPQLAWVDVASSGRYTLSAMRLDGEKQKDARYFHMKPGAHRLELRLGRERAGRGNGSDWQHCRILLDYDNFQAGQRYDIFVVLMGHGVRVWLRDAQGRRIKESRNPVCGSQY